MVRAFDELSEVGRLRRLRRFAEEAVVERYGLSQPKVRLLSQHSFNTMFRVDADGERFVLRVGGAVRIHAFGVEDVEAHWLKHLAASTPTTAPQPIASLDHAWRIDFETEGVSASRPCSMFTFIEGRELRQTKFDAAAAHKAGALLANLHEDAATALPPIDANPALRADRVVYFHKENLIGEYESETGALLSEALDRVQSVIDDLWKHPPHRPHVLHGDFGAHNVLTWCNELRPIDFQDLQVGFDIQDLGITLADLGRSTPDLVPHFEKGYGTVRPLPELPPQLLAAFAAGRSLNMMNLGLHLRTRGIGWSLDRHSKLVQEWMAGSE